MSFMPNPGSIVRLKSGEIAVVIKVTPDGRDDRAEVIRVSWGKLKTKEVRIKVDEIEEIIEEREWPENFRGFDTNVKPKKAK